MSVAGMAQAQLAFDPTSLEVEVDGEATAMLSFPGLTGGIMLGVMVSSANPATAQVAPESVMVTFTADTPSHDVTIAGVAKGEVVVMAVGSSLGFLASAELMVTVVSAPEPVDLTLAFDPSVLEVTAGSSATVTLSLLDRPASSMVTVTVSTTGEAARLVTPDRLMFTATTTNLEVTVEGVAEGEATVTADVDTADLPSDVSVAGAELTVTVVPAPIHLQLAFDSTSLKVAAGSSATVTLRLPDVPADATVFVGLRIIRQDEPLVKLVRPETAIFSAGITSHDVTVEGVAVGNATLRAEEATSRLPPDSTVALADLAVTVVPPPVHLRLAFDPPALEVTAGSSATVMLSLPDVPAGFLVSVEVSVAGEAVEQVGGFRVGFDRTVPPYLVTIEGVSAGNATLTAVRVDCTIDTLATHPECGLPPNSTVEPAELLVTVLPPTVHLQLAFETTSLEVMAGTTTTVMLRLLGDVPAGAMVEARAFPEKETTAQVVTGLVVFDAATTSHAVTVAGVVAGNAMVVAFALNRVGVSADSSVGNAFLQVTVVPVPPIMLFAFDPTSLTVVAGATATAVLSLLGDVPASAKVLVELSVADATTARVVTPESVVLDADTPSHAVAIAGVAEGSATVTAEAMGFIGLPEGSSVASTELAVTVVLPTVHLQLAFDTTSLTVAVGSEETVVLSLVGVPAGAMVTVGLSAMDETTAQVVTAPVTFDAETTSRKVTVLGVATGNTTVISVEITPGGLSDDSTIAPAELAVTVVLPTVALELAFDPPVLAVAPGSSRTATLSLSGVPMGAAVTVELSAADSTTARLVTEPELRFTAETPSYDVTVAGVAEGSATVTAELVSFLGLSEASTVLSAQLPITVAPGLRLRARVLLEGPLQ